jgi:hypothetical protein
MQGATRSYVCISKCATKYRHFMLSVTAHKVTRRMTFMGLQMTLGHNQRRLSLVDLYHNLNHETELLILLTNSSYTGDFSVRHISYVTSYQIAYGTTVTY